MSVLCIPAECDNIKLPYNGEIASRWDAYMLCAICRHFASVMLHFASLITHNLRCIPAYTHQIPTGFSSATTQYAWGGERKPASNPYGIFTSHHHYAANGARAFNLSNF